MSKVVTTEAPAKIFVQLTTPRCLTRE